MFFMRIILLCMCNRFCNERLHFCIAFLYCICCLTISLFFSFFFDLCVYELHILCILENVCQIKYVDCKYYERKEQLPFLILNQFESNQLRFQLQLNGGCSRCKKYKAKSQPHQLNEGIQNMSAYCAKEKFRPSFPYGQVLNLIVFKSSDMNPINCSLHVNIHAFLITFEKFTHLQVYTFKCAVYRFHFYILLCYI